MDRLGVAPGARKTDALLHMPGMSGNVHVENAQKRSARHPRNLDAVAVLRCYIRDQSSEGSSQRLFLIEPEHGGLDFSSHEE
jgi:hypothetical protein